jgi:hypothetical protein
MRNTVNWRQAVAEVGLLLIAAAVALAIDSWSDASRERTDERSHLLSLRSDFVATDSTFQVQLGGTEQQAEHVRRFIKTLEGQPGSVPTDSLSGMVRESFLWYRFAPVLTTYSDLVNSGDLGLLRSDSLRAALAEFIGYMDEIGPFLDMGQAQWEDQVTPYYVRHFNVAILYGPRSAFAVADTTNPGYNMGSEVPRIRSEEAAFWSREFLNLLAVRMIILEDTIYFVERAVVRVKRIMRLVDDALVNG